VSADSVLEVVGPDRPGDIAELPADLERAADIGRELVESILAARRDTPRETA